MTTINTTYGPATIRTATQDDLAYIIDRQRRHSHQVGFIPRTNLEQLVDRRTVWIPEINDTPIGTIVCSGGTLCPLCFRQHTVESELWNHGVGHALTKHLIEELAPARTEYDTLRILTRDDVAAQVRINLRLGGRLTGRTRSGTRGVPTREYVFQTGLPSRG